MNISFSQTTLDFTATPVSGCAPLEVRFSIAPNISYQSLFWDLGNGTFAGNSNPSTIYLNPGKYTVKLVVTYPDQRKDSITKTNYITAYGKPNANFTATKTSGCAPFTTTFQDLSTTEPGTTITSRTWNFSDGGSITTTDPTVNYTFNKAGIFDVVLTVTNSGGCVSTAVVRSNYITVSPPLIADFTFTQSGQCKPPETVFFTNNTSGTGTITYNWDYGDGLTATGRNPSHVYSTSGTYTIKLSAANQLGCTSEKSQSIVISDAKPVINGPDSVCINAPASFSITSKLPPVRAVWDFGDGSPNSTSLTPTKRWLLPGVYQVKVISYYQNCVDSSTRPITVITSPPIDFIADDSGSCKVPLTVNFTDVSQGSNAWTWNFGGTVIPSTSSTQSFTFTTLPPDSGYDISLTVSNKYGCSDSITKKSFIKFYQPSVTINNDEGGGCLPYTFSPTVNLFATDTAVAYQWSFPGADPATSTDKNPSVVYNSLGKFDVSVTVTTSDGCQANTTLPEAVETGEKPTADFTVSLNAACAGTPFNFTNASSTTDRWQWDFGDDSTGTTQNASHAYNDTGSFTVQLIAWNNGCPDTAIKPQLINVYPAVALFSANYNCTNKYQVIFKDSSILPQTHSWNFGDGATSPDVSPSHTYASPGDYNVSLTVTNGSCTHTTTNTIKIIDENPDLVVLEDTVCRASDVSFSAININPANISKYIWDYGDGNTDTTTSEMSTHKYFQNGIFTVVLTTVDIRGCTKTIVKNDLVKTFAPKASFTTTTSGGCINTAIHFTDLSTPSSSNNSIISWTWNFGDGQTATIDAPNSPDIDHQFTNSANFFAGLTVTDQFGCKDSVFAVDPISITQPKAIFLTQYPHTCINDTIPFLDFSTGLALKYKWDFGDGTTDSIGDTRKAYTANGDYDVTLTITDTNGCVSSVTQSKYIQVRDIVASFKMSDSVGKCIPFFVKFTNTSLNADSSLWAYGDGFATVNANPTHNYVTSDTFLVRLTVSRGLACRSVATNEVIVNAPSAQIIYQPLSGCAPLGVKFSIKTNDELSFLWDFNDGTTLSTTDTFASHSYVFLDEHGTFVPRLVIKDSNNCSINIFGKDTIRLFSAKVNFGADNKFLCDNGFVQFSDSTISGSSVTSYKWDFGDGSPQFLGQIPPPHQYTSVGKYSVSLIVNTASGCSDTLIKKDFITVAQKPSISITGPTDTCGAASINWQGNLISSDNSAVNWNWNFGNGNASQLQNPPSQTYSDTNLYNISLIAISASGCSDTATTTIDIHPIPNVYAGADTTICLNDGAQLQATGADTYTWQPATNLNCVNCANPTASPTADITYNVTGATVYGCTNTDEISIEVKQPFNLSGLQALDSICLGKNILLNVTGAENYIWSPSSGLSNSTSSSVTASPTTTTTYKVVGYDSKNCFFDSAFIQLRVNPNPTVNAGEDQKIQLGNSVQLTTQYSSDVVSWLWTPATGLSCINCPNPIASPEPSTTYTITVTNGSKCTASDQVFVRVVCDNSNLFVPTAFTPNNDGLNDVFYPMGVGLFKIQSLRIFNRFGEAVFLKTNVSANDRSGGWDGTFKGKPADMGAYVYALEVICKNGEILTLNGKILLIR